jgi:hypothetical protein
MFNILYRCPRTVARHENGPLHESRRRYLEQVAAQGAALHTLRGAAGIIYRAAIWTELDESSPVERKEVERAANRWAHRSYRNASCRGPQQTDKEFRQTTGNWLRFAGRLLESDRSPAPYQQEIGALCRYMDVERGLSPATIATVRQSLGKFFKHTRVHQLSKLKIADVERFLALLGKQGWTRHGIRSMAHQLRLFPLWRADGFDETGNGSFDSRCTCLSARAASARSRMGGRSKVPGQYGNESESRHPVRHSRVEPTCFVTAWRLPCWAPGRPWEKSEKFFGIDPRTQRKSTRRSTSVACVHWLTPGR